MRSQHPFDPIYDKYSEILILGSFPSVKSREISFYYGHPQNRFWKVMSAVLCCAEPVGTPEKTDFLLSHRIALWDTVKSCEITDQAMQASKCRSERYRLFAGTLPHPLHLRKRQGFGESVPQICPAENGTARNRASVHKPG
jgi:G:T/U-mismatch repair DNA glycosylase